MKKVKRIIVSFMTFCVMFSLVTIPTKANDIAPQGVSFEDINDFINNPENSMRVNQGVCYIDTKGASDEYYSCGNPVFTGPEDVMQISNDGDFWYNLGERTVGSYLATKWVGTGALIACFVMSAARWYDRNTVHYTRLGNMTCTVYEAMGNFKYYAKYKNIMFEVRKEYEYN